jgi:hypothetical protein
MASDKKVNLELSKSSVDIIEVPDGYTVTGNFTIRLKKRKESFPEFTERLDNWSNELRNSIMRKVANHLGIGVRFEE